MKIEVDVEGYEVHGFNGDKDLVAQTAYELASDIGMRLADLASEVAHGDVTIRVGENGSVQGSSTDVEP